MQRDLTTSQLLRLAVNKYGELIGIQNYYEIVKRKEWKVKKASDRSEEWQKMQLDKFRAGIDGIEQGFLSRHELILESYKRHVKVKGIKLQ